VEPKSGDRVLSTAVALVLGVVSSVLAVSLGNPIGAACAYLAQEIGINPDGPAAMLLWAVGFGTIVAPVGILLYALDRSRRGRPPLLFVLDYYFTYLVCSIFAWMILIHVLENRWHVPQGLLDSYPLPRFLGGDGMGGVFGVWWNGGWRTQLLTILGFGAGFIFGSILSWPVVRLIHRYREPLPGQEFRDQMEER
jgi:hypothetical protein